MNILLLGDIMGKAGRTAVMAQLPTLRQKWQIDCVVANGENAASGFGISSSIARGLFDCGVDVITLGNHAFDNREIMNSLESESRILRPLNIATQAPGRGAFLYNIAGKQIMVINALGRVFMSPNYADPFAAVDYHLTQAPLGEVADAIIIDFHAEATSEKQAMGLWCDGRASVVFGTHTHTPTADQRILPEGTAFQTDIGMCGDYNSVVGMDSEEPLCRFVTGMNSSKFTPATGPATLCGLLVEIGVKGLATKITPLRLGGALQPME